VLALIKSLIYAREEEDALEARLNKIDQSRSKLSADMSIRFQTIKKYDNFYEISLMLK